MLYIRIYIVNKPYSNNKKDSSPTSRSLKVKDIFIRHPYIYKNRKSLDLDNFVNQIFFKQKSRVNTRIFSDTKFIVVSVQNSLHYKYLLDREKYLRIYKEYIDITEQTEHSIDKFDELVNTFNLDVLKKNKIQLYPYAHKGKNIYIVIDGAHRLAIYTKNYEMNLENKFYELVNKGI